MRRGAASDRRMRLTIGRLRALSELADMCEYPREVETCVLPALADLSEGELSALVGILFERDMRTHARSVIAYMRASAKLGHPADPVGLWDDWQHEFHL